MMNLNGMIRIAMIRSLLFVALTTLNLFAEGEPKMPIEFRSITEKGGGHG